MVQDFPSAPQWRHKSSSASAAEGGRTRAATRTLSPPREPSGAHVPPHGQPASLGAHGAEAVSSSQATDRVDVRGVAVSQAATLLVDATSAHGALHVWLLLRRAAGRRKGVGGLDEPLLAAPLPADSSEELQ